MKIGIFALIMVLSVPLLAQSNTQQKMNSDKVKIEIWSDVVCPFCLLGKKKLDQAIAKYNAQDQVEVIWHSFQLDPDFPMNESMPTTKSLSERKGYPVNQIKGMCDQLAAQGLAYGIDFQFEKALSFNTLDVHRLIQWAKTANKSNELKVAFMNAHFTDGVDLSVHSNILSVVEKVGLDREKAKLVLESDAFETEVKQDISRAQQLGIRGVPYFLINEKSVISGAQHDGVFENAISAAIKNLPSAENTTQKGVCLPDGECD